MKNRVRELRKNQKLTQLKKKNLTLVYQLPLKWQIFLKQPLRTFLISQNNYETRKKKQLYIMAYYKFYFSDVMVLVK